MNFESDHLVLQYLGSVGDAAAGRLKPGERARLAERLRSRINSERERLGAHTAASVQLILDEIGTPAAVVGDELYRLGNLRAAGEDDAGDDMSMRASRHATVARQIGFRADSTPILSEAGKAAAPAAPAAPQGDTVVDGPPTLAETAAAEEPGAAADEPDGEAPWWRERPAPTLVGDGLIHAPAYPVGVATSVSGADEPVAETAPELAAADDNLVREIFALVLLLVGAIVASTTVVVLGCLVVFTAGVWTVTERRTAALYVPGATVAAFAIAMWMRATGRFGDDLTRSEAGDRFEELLPTMARVAAVVAALYLGWRMSRRAVNA